MVNIAAHGQYTYGEYFVRPKASLTYSYIESDGYDLKGNVLGFPIDVAFPEDSFNFGIVEASTEFSRIFVFENGTTVMPFAEIGATYAFDQPNDGQILTADLELATPSAWSGNLRAGARMLLNNSVQVEASGAISALARADWTFGKASFRSRSAFEYRQTSATVVGGARRHRQTRPPSHCRNDW